MGNADARSALPVALLSIILFDAAVSQDRTWLTVNNMSISSFITNSTDTSLDIICNSEVSSGVVRGQYIYRAQEFTYNFFNGSDDVAIRSGLFQICDSFSAPANTSEYTCLGSIEETPQRRMSTGIRLKNLSPYTSASFYCESYYGVYGRVYQMNSTVLRIDADGPVTSSLSAFGINNNGSQTELSSTSGIFNVSQYKMVFIVCYVNSFNKVPSYQMFLNEDDVSYAVNTSGSYGNISYIAGFPGAKNFSSIKYQIKASYQFSSVTCSNWTVVCTSWAKISPSQKVTTQARFSSSFCTHQSSSRSDLVNKGIEGNNGSHLINRVLASQSSNVPVSIITLSLGLIFTIAIKL